ncbi:MAG: hypothetical protein DMG04_31130 [Acidobacteria bacterium]|nr:MAG: hypothetical protein DMG04_31130 [Acidobacteriota bacterium]
MKVHLRVLMFGALVAACAAPALAQIDQGRLTGTVTDTQGGVLPGVTVTAKSPALIGTRSVVSEADGKYSLPALPSGDYELSFEHRLHDRQARWRSHGHRRVGGARPGVGRPHERLRRRRQPQESTDRLRELWHP